MAPAKKREKDNNADGAATNGLNGMSNGTADAATASSTATATAGATVPPTPAEGQAKLNGHQQEQELFLQAFESEYLGWQKAYRGRD